LKQIRAYKSREPTPIGVVEQGASNDAERQGNQCKKAGDNSDETVNSHDDSL
jgi:hypothetical protein